MLSLKSGGCADEAVHVHRDGELSVMRAMDKLCAHPAIGPACFAVQADCA